MILTSEIALQLIIDLLWCFCAKMQYWRFADHVNYEERLSFWKYRPHPASFWFIFSPEKWVIPSIYIVLFSVFKNGLSTASFWFIFSPEKWAIHGIFLVDFQSSKMGYPSIFLVYIQSWKMGYSQHLFGLFSSFQTNITIVNKKSMWKMSIQYMVPGIKPTPFRARVFSHNP